MKRMSMTRLSAITFMLAAASAATSMSALADAYRCDLTEDSVLCQWGSTTPPSARVIHVPPDLTAEAQDRLRKWQAFCQPKPETDRYGVVRLRYAHAGCEFGRTE